jgi:hypothetical protein
MRTSSGVSETRTKFGLRLEQSAKQILAHAKGEKKLPILRIVLPDKPAISSRHRTPSPAGLGIDATEIDKSRARSGRGKKRRAGCRPSIAVALALRKSLGPVTNLSSI